MINVNVNVNILILIFTIILILISNLTFIAINIIIATKSTIDITTKLLFKNLKTK